MEDKFLLIVGIVALIAPLIFGIGMTIWSVNDYLIENRLKKEGVVIKAKVVDRDITVHARTTNSYSLKYMYKIKDTNNLLQTYERGTTVKRKLHYSLGSKIEIKYLKDRPNVSRIVGNDNDSWGLMLILGFDFFIIIVYGYLGSTLNFSGNKELEE